MKKKLFLIPVISLGLFGGITGGVSANAQEPISDLESISAIESAAALESATYKQTTPSSMFAFIRLVSFTPTEDGTATVSGYQSETFSGSIPFKTMYKVSENDFADILVKEFNGNGSVNFSIPVKAGKKYTLYVNRTSAANYKAEYTVNGKITYQ
ncbi:hypothetical protein ACFVT8_16760 [Lysinibacillus sp. NPDC058147]|uniref:hypothetical protein n=1 Tax=unclassified Lysinibacillus TaxID=2636778 RepID=UPI0036D97337